MRFSENHRKGDQDFPVKMGVRVGGKPYRGFVYRREGKHCFSLMMYAFCSNNALYAASLSFAMFSF